MCALSLGSLQTSALIGRESEKRIIRTAVQADGLRVIYIVGEAGIGKTRLLNEIPDAAQGTDVAVPELIDLYHVDAHTISSIENAIMEAITADHPQQFERYRQLRKLFVSLRDKGGSPERIQEVHSQLAPQFIEDFNAFTAHQRIVLRFDTIELVQSEREIHPLLSKAHALIEVRGWLATYVPQMQNVLIVFAGRPESILWNELQQALSQKAGDRLAFESGQALPTGWETVSQTQIRLGPLERTETEQYFADLCVRNERIARAQLEEDHYRIIQRITGGRPLHLAFIATLLAKGERLPDDLLGELAEHPIEDYAEELLMAVWHLSPLIYDILPYVAILRKGVNGPLLSRVMTDQFGTGWGLAKTRRALAELRALPFAKTRAKSKLVFLHDEMYDLMDRFVLDPDPAWIEARIDACRVAIAWYDEQIEKTSPRRKPYLRVERFYYELLENPNKGFEHFERMSDAALVAREVGFEIAMHDEMLRFFTQRKMVRELESGELSPWGRRIARDSATRWVQRQLRQNRHEETLQTESQIWDYGASPFEKTETQLMPGILLAYRGEAHAYLNHLDQARAALQEAVSRLEALEGRTGTEWREDVRRYVLGLVYNNLGFVGARQRNYVQAIRNYLRSIGLLAPLADKKGMRAAQIQRAETQRNLAYIYGELGEWTNATYFCSQALETFQNLGYQWGEALSLNVYGGIEYRYHHPHRSCARCQDALDLFVKIEDTRGIGLSTLWLGRAQRKLGSQYTYEDQPQSEDYLTQSAENLQRARHIFENEIVEPVRLLETIAEQGKLYRNWAARCRHQEGQESAEVQAFVQQSKDTLQTAIAMADEQDATAERADYRHDLAELYYGTGQYETALEVLNEAEALLPEPCKMTKGRTLPCLECKVSGYLEILAKICATRGNIAHLAGDLEQALKKWTLTFGYLYAFSPSAGRFPNEIATDIGHKLFDMTSTELIALRNQCLETIKQYELPVPNRLLEELDERIKTAKQREGLGDAPNAAGECTT